ncbi:MAG: hypothetical protein MR581_09115 [Lachnospiraceae bacterium]|nr:hypothetical protein [Lachnospiraceae bacterium]
MYQQAEELAGLNYRTALRNIQEIQDTSAAVCGCLRAVSDGAEDGGAAKECAGEKYWTGNMKS